MAFTAEVKKEHTWRTRADFLDRIDRIYLIFIYPVDPVKKWKFLCYQDMVRQIHRFHYILIGIRAVWPPKRKRPIAYKPSALNSKH
jgi:hypothetical protein